MSEQYPPSGEPEHLDYGGALRCHTQTPRPGADGARRRRRA